MPFPFSDDLEPQHELIKPLHILLRDPGDTIAVAQLLKNLTPATENEPIQRALALVLEGSAWSSTEERHIPVEIALEGIPLAEGRVDFLISRRIDSGAYLPILRINDDGEIVGPLIIHGNFATEPVVLTDAATIAIDASLANSFRVTLEGNRILGNALNGVDGQVMVIEIHQDGTGSRTITLDTKYRLSTTVPSITLTTTPYWIDIATFKFNAPLDCWFVVAFHPGFAPQPAEIEKEYVETITLVDVIAATIGISFNESMTMSDESTIDEIGQGLSFDETITTSDTTTIGIGLIVNESMTLSDAMVGVDPTREYGDDLNAAPWLDEIVYSLESSGIAALHFDASDQLVMSDELAFILSTANLNASDSMTLTDGIAFTLNYLKSVNDSNTLSDAIATGGTGFTVETFTVSGSWECPEGVTHIKVECIGGGANGDIGYLGVVSGQGGGGGGYSRTNVKVVTPGNTYNYIVGEGGPIDGQRKGGQSSFDGGTIAKGANGANGGSTIGATGDVKYPGGGAYGEFYGDFGSGGGGAAGSSGAGTDSLDQNGAPGTGVGGGDGGDGGSPSQDGQPGSTFGGGGGGGGKVSGHLEGGDGADGMVRITY